MKKAYITLIAGAILLFSPLHTTVRLIGAATVIAAVIAIMYLTLKRVPSKLTKEEFLKLRFSERRILQAGPPCPAEWQVKPISGGIYHVSCRKCGVTLQSGCTPKCLNNGN